MQNNGQRRPVRGRRGARAVADPLAEQADGVVGNLCINLFCEIAYISINYLCCFTAAVPNQRRRNPRRAAAAPRPFRMWLRSFVGAVTDAQRVRQDRANAKPSKW